MGPSAGAAVIAAAGAAGARQPALQGHVAHHGLARARQGANGARAPGELAHLAHCGAPALPARPRGRRDVPRPMPAGAQVAEARQAGLLLHRRRRHQEVRRALHRRGRLLQPHGQATPDLRRDLR
eukprot:3629090-Lingulodinium_polyedra.AAC.1